MAVGQALIDQGHFGSDKVQERLDEVNEKWDNLVEMMDSRKRRLTEAVDFHQFLTDADDVDTWMLDILRLVSSDDTGKDEANVQVNYLVWLIVPNWSKIVWIWSKTVHLGSLRFHNFKARRKWGFRILNLTQVRWISSDWCPLITLAKMRPMYR